jgi:predicted NACHT family NTPase
LMILGRPGAGKTTFMKRLAMLCSLGEKFEDRVPIFVTLKEFSDKPEKPGLLNFIGKAEAVQQILSAGRSLVLLDGLDEVQEAEHDRVLAEIRDFSRRYDQNVIIITCRIAAREYIFEQFTEVEIANFNEEQIEDFVTKWFRVKNPQQATLFLERLKTSDPVKELATNPLLLTLLCLEFEEASEFPASRAELYQRGLNVLLTKWDGQRGIKRDVVYKKLSTKRKESLLGKLAMQTFKQGDYFFKQAVAEQHISLYIQNLPDASSDPEALIVDSHAVLKAIESQHGLLVERATEIYSFSHLIFHEYFVSKYLFEHSDRDRILKQLLERSTEKRWREVFLLLAEQLEPADTLLQKLKLKTDEILRGDRQFQKYLAWVKTKSSSVQEHTASVLRAYYYTLDLPLRGDPKVSRSLALDYSFQGDCSTFSELSHTLSLSVDRALTLSQAISFNLENAFSLSLILNRDLAIKNNENSALKKKIHLLMDELPSTSEKNRRQFQFWWKAKGENWTNQLRQVLISYCNIGRNWQFTDEQKQKLQKYYEANTLLIDCLNSECYVSRWVREEIEETLFLPIAEIEKWKQEHRPS